MPRWHGSPVEFERFASETATKGPLGEQLYARIAAEGLVLTGAEISTSFSVCFLGRAGRVAPHIKTLADYFVTSDGKSLLDVLQTAFSASGGAHTVIVR